MLPEILQRQDQYHLGYIQILICSHCQLPVERQILKNGSASNVPQLSLVCNTDTKPQEDKIDSTQPISEDRKRKEAPTQDSAQPPTQKKIKL